MNVKRPAEAPAVKETNRLLRPQVASLGIWAPGVRRPGAQNPGELRPPLRQQGLGSESRGPCRRTGACAGPSASAEGPGSRPTSFLVLGSRGPSQRGPSARRGVRDTSPQQEKTAATTCPICARTRKARHLLALPTPPPPGTSRIWTLGDAQGSGARPLVPQTSTVPQTKERRRRVGPLGTLIAHLAAGEGTRGMVPPSVPRYHKGEEGIRLGPLRSIPETHARGRFPRPPGPHLRPREARRGLGRLRSGGGTGTRRDGVVPGLPARSRPETKKPRSNIRGTDVALNAGPPAASARGHPHGSRAPMLPEARRSETRGGARAPAGSEEGGGAGQGACAPGARPGGLMEKALAS